MNLMIFRFFFAQSANEFNWVFEAEECSICPAIPVHNRIMERGMV